MKRTLCGETIKEMVCMRRLAHVPRWQVVPTLRTQSVLEHSIGVMYIAKAIAETLDLDFDRSDVLRALAHDKDEAIKGDTPSTAKVAKNPTDFYDVAFVMIKSADYIESLVYLYEEEAMGNNQLADLFEVVRSDAFKWTERLFLLLDTEFTLTMAEIREAARQLIQQILYVYRPNVHPAITYRNDPE
jgi:hypothetical protein